MGLDYFIFYAEANIVCVLILSMILINDRIYSTQQEKQVWFNRVIISFILYFVSDIGWAAVIGGQLPRTRSLVVLFNLTNYVLLSLMAYQWFMYMAASEKMPFRQDRKRRMLYLLPMAVSLLIIVAAYAAAPFFWINENNELNSLYYPLFIAAPAESCGRPFCLLLHRAFFHGRGRTSATATSLTLVPVGPVMMRPPTACRA